MPQPCPIMHPCKSLLGKAIVLFIDCASDPQSMLLFWFCHMPQHDFIKETFFSVKKSLHHFSSVILYTNVSCTSSCVYPVLNLGCPLPGWIKLFLSSVKHSVWLFPLVICQDLKTESPWTIIFFFLKKGSLLSLPTVVR